MYHRILTAPVQKTVYMTPEVDDLEWIHEQAYDIVCKLLQREPTNRLGYNGFDEIKSHPWFGGIDWDKLYRKEIEPPFRPTVKDDESTEQIDPEFTNVVPAVTPTPVNAVLTDQNAFKDFSYAEGCIQSRVCKKHVNENLIQSACSENTNHVHVWTYHDYDANDDDDVNGCDFGFLNNDYMVHTIHSYGLYCLLISSGVFRLFFAGFTDTTNPATFVPST